MLLKTWGDVLRAHMEHALITKQSDLTHTLLLIGLDTGAVAPIVLLIGSCLNSNAPILVEEGELKLAEDLAEIATKRDPRAKIAYIYIYIHIYNY